MTSGEGERPDPGAALLFFLLVSAPLLRGAWDLWAQTLVRAGLVLCAGWLLLFRRGVAVEDAGPRWGWALFLTSFFGLRNSPYAHSAFPASLNDFAALLFFFCAAALAPAARIALPWASAVASAAASLLFLFMGPQRALDWVINPNVLAALVLLGWPLWLRGGEGEPPVRRAARAAVLAVLGAALFLTDSRAAWMILPFQALAATRLLSGKRLRPVAAVAFCLLATGLLAAGALDPDRLAWWRGALAMAARHPFLGVGPGAFGEAYPGFRPAGQELNTLYAHGFLWEILAERGLFGATVLFASFCLGARRVWRADLSRDDALVALGLGGFILHSLVHIGFSLPGPAWTFWALCGVLWAQATPNAAAPGGPFRWTVGAVAGVAALFSFTLFRADQCLVRARAAAAGAQWDEAEMWAERSLFFNSRHPEPHSLIASAAASRGAWKRATEEAGWAVLRSPHAFRFHWEAAEIARVSGQPEDALRHYDSATAALPLNPRPAFGRGQVLWSQGRRPEARAALQKVLSLLEVGRGMDLPPAEREGMRQSALALLEEP